MNFGMRPAGQPESRIVRPQADRRYQLTTGKMQMTIETYLGRRARFYGPAALGLGVWLATPGQESGPIRLLIAGDVFFASHIAAMLALASSSPDTFRHRASRGDEGLPLIAFITLAAITLALGSVFTLLNHDLKPGLFQFALSIASVPLGWLMLHTVLAFHYAHAYFGDHGGGDGSGAGLVFPGGAEPQAWDFLYHSFVIGMTAQVSDVSVVTTRMRRLTLAHSVVSFFFNTVIVAIAVNTAVVLAP